MGPMLRILIVMPFVGLVLLRDPIPAVAQEGKGVLDAAFDTIRVSAGILLIVAVAA